MEFKQLESPTLKDLFVKEIETLILSGKLKIGERLPNERDLAAKMKVSRAVINGGITELAAKGFLDVRPRKGTFVADYKKTGKLEILESLLEYNGGHFDPAMLAAIFEVRESSEKRTVRLAAQRRSEEDLQALAEKLVEIEGLTDPEALSVATFEYYHLLNIATGNMIYPLMHHAFRSIYIPLMQVTYGKGLKADRLAMMKRLVTAIADQEPDTAEACVQEIIDWGRDYFQTNYAQGQAIG